MNLLKDNITHEYVIMAHTGSLTLDDIIIGLTSNKVFLQLQTSPFFEQGSSSAKSVVTHPAQCVSMSLLVQAQQYKQSQQTTQSPHQVIQPSDAISTIVEKVNKISPSIKPLSLNQADLIDCVLAKPVTLKDLKTHKIVSIRDMATSMGISTYVIVDGQKKLKLKESLIEEIYGALKSKK